MKKLLCVLVSLSLVFSYCVSGAYAKGNARPDKSGYREQYDHFKKQLKQYYKNMDKRKELLRDIAKLKKKYGEYSIGVFVNGEEVEFDVPPVIKQGKMLIPVRPITKALGADIEWDRETGTIVITKGDKIIEIKADSNIVKVNGVEVKLDDYIKIYGNRTMVPISFIIKILRHKVDVDDESGSVIIDEDEKTGVLVRQLQRRVERR